MSKFFVFFLLLFVVVSHAQVATLTQAYSGDSISISADQIVLARQSLGFTSVTTDNPGVNYLINEPLDSLSKWYSPCLIRLNIPGGNPVLVGAWNIDRVNRGRDGSAVVITKLPRQTRYITSDPFWSISNAYSLCYIPSATPVIKSYFSSESGSDSDGERGNPFKPFQTIWGVPGTERQIISDKSSYLRTGPYSGNGNDYSLNGNGYFHLSGPIENIHYSSYNGVFGGFLGDFYTTFGTSYPVNVFIDTPETVYELTATSSISAVAAYYDEETNLFLRAKEFRTNSGRSWGTQFGCKNFDVEVDSVVITGGVVNSIYTSYNSSGASYAPNRKGRVKIGYAEFQSIGDDKGAIRIQDGMGQNLDVSVEVGTLKSVGNDGKFVLINPNQETSTGMSYKLLIHEIIDETPGSQPVMSFFTSNNGVEDSLINSEISIRIEKLTNNGNEILYDGAALDESECYGVDFSLSIGEGNFSTPGRIRFEDHFMQSGSTFRIHCDNCVSTASNPIILLENTSILDATSKIIISGRWEHTGAQSLIDIGANFPGDIILENLTLINDGTVPAVSASVAESVIVKNVYTNSTVVDGDVTEVVESIVKNSSVK